jgi:hypothetical protein
MYSLVNVTVVARDLTRHPHGSAVARDLLQVLALDHDALVQLDAVPARADAARRRQQLATERVDAPRALDALAEVRQAAVVGGLDAWSSALPVLEAAPIGGRVELLRWVRTELLAEAWESIADLSVPRLSRALEVVSDGVLTTYAGRPGDPLARPWRAWTNSHLPATSTEPAVEQVVEMVAGASRASLVTAGAVMRSRRAGGWSWPHAMHDACWAVELTGRTRTAAVAQLEAVRALLSRHAGVPAPDIVAAVAAAVHATVVADVLPAETVAAMCGPLLAHLS